MCVACEIDNGDRTKLFDNSKTGYKLYMENVCNVFRLHMTDGIHHNTRDIYSCPFCGRRFVNK